MRRPNRKSASKYIHKKTTEHNNKLHILSSEMQFQDFFLKFANEFHVS